MNTHQDYIADAISYEAAVVAEAQKSTRNYVLNRSAFKLGAIPGMPSDTAVGALLQAANANGYVADHGERATRNVIESGLQSGQRKQQKVLRPNRAEHRRMASESKLTVSSGPSPIAVSPLFDADLAQPTFPPPARRQTRMENLAFRLVATKARQKGATRSGITCLCESRSLCGSRSCERMAVPKIGIACGMWTALSAGKQRNPTPL